MTASIEIENFKGKTFSLYGDESDSNNYYSTIKRTTDILLRENSFSEEELLNYLKGIDKKKRLLKKISTRKSEILFNHSIFPLLKNELSIYTKETENHLKNLTLRKKFDKTISTSEEQYHLYMVEIELVNRIYSAQFRKCEYKIALLPHCLHDLNRTCMSKPDEIDYRCMGCSKNCFINHLNKILREANTDAYIWRQADLKKLFAELHKKYNTIGVLGVACIPELINGMKLCIKQNLPVIGIPLDANRCRRWMGEFHYNTINLKKVKEIVGK